MKTRHFAGRSGRINRKTAPALPLKVFIGYADLPAVRRATTCVIEAAAGSGRNVEIQPLLWRAQQLASSHWRDRAITAALDADIVVLTSTHGGPFVPEFDLWVRHFLRASHQRPVTLVAVAGADAWTITLEQPTVAPKAATMSPDADQAVRHALVA